MVFLDSNIRLGKGLKPCRFETSTPDEAHRMLDFFGIHQALVRLEIQENWSAVEGNKDVVDFCTNSDDKGRLLPVWDLLPSCCGDFPRPAELVSAMKKAGILALAVLRNIQFPLEEPLFSGETLSALEEAKIPLLYPVDSEPEFIILGKILKNFPLLELIACINKPAWGIDRYSWPLFEKFPGFHISTGGYHISGSVQETVKRFGPRTFVFGSAYPYLNPGGAVEFLKRLDISEKDKELIASGTMLRLLDWGKYL